MFFLGLLLLLFPKDGYWSCLYFSNSYIGSFFVFNNVCKTPIKLIKQTAVIPTQENKELH